MPQTISSYCIIKKNSVWLNGQELPVDKSATELSPFLAALYRQLNVNYPKFFKMDNLCKLGMLATELVIRNNPDFEKYPKDKVAIVFSNQASSMDTDRNHVKTIEDKNNYFPSPALFVYTLPNIVIGEIAIKHKLTGENAFFISEKMDIQLLQSYTSILLATDKTDAVLCGWVNVDGNAYEAFVYCVEKTNFNEERNEATKHHDFETIQLLYKNI
jgi:hypothetical protein